MLYRFCAWLLFGGLGILLAECLIFGAIEELRGKDCAARRGGGK